MNIGKIFLFNEKTDHAIIYSKMSYPAEQEFILVVVRK